MLKPWEALANFESFELVKREYALRHGRTPGRTHAREIAAPFVHARSYFRTAGSAELTVKPLLLYYGVLNLSRGLTLSLLRSRREATLSPSHGLSIKDWGTELSKEKPDFSALAVTVNGAGALVVLAEATRNKSLLRAGSSIVGYTNPPVPTGAVFSLGDLLARIPLLQDHHVRWRNLSRCGPVEFDPSNNQQLAIVKVPKARKHVTAAFCQALFEGTAFALDFESTGHFIFKGPNSVDEQPGLTDFVNPALLNIGELWATARYPNGSRLSKITTAFVLAYMLGMLVRYFPTQWTALVRGQIEDAALPTIAAAVELVEAEFPQVVLDFLSDRTSHQ